ncbi:MAG: Hsp33 family molecular chaperone HslO [Eubacteriales bacterium]|nr:Hsp33 family molecular chaperone HslO [Eubacteriales bacterium]
MNDYLIRATASDGMIRAFAAVTTDTVEEARKAHGTSPIATAALGRLMTGALMMGADMKNDDDLVTININCQGPIGGLVVTADRNGHVKGYVQNPLVMLPANDKGKLDVGGALDLGVLTVIKDIGLKEPYTGQTILISGEIADDLTYYYATSEQIPSSVALGVLMNKENTVRRAGGFMVQLMPGCPDEIAEKLETRLNGIEPVTSMLEKGMSPEDILNFILEGMNPDIKDEKTDVSFYCNCSRERVEKALISVGKDELNTLIEEGKPAELNCQFCGKKYEFSVDDLKELIKKV